MASLSGKAMYVAGMIEMSDAVLHTSELKQLKLDNFRNLGLQLRDKIAGPERPVANDDDFEALGYIIRHKFSEKESKESFEKLFNAAKNSNEVALGIRLKYILLDFVRSYFVI